MNNLSSFQKMSSFNKPVATRRKQQVYLKTDHPNRSMENRQLWLTTTTKELLQTVALSLKLLVVRLQSKNQYGLQVPDHPIKERLELVLCYNKKVLVKSTFLCNLGTILTDIFASCLRLMKSHSRAYVPMRQH